MGSFFSIGSVPGLSQIWLCSVAQAGLELKTIVLPQPSTVLGWSVVQNPTYCFWVIVVCGLSFIFVGVEGTEDTVICEMFFNSKR